MEVVQDYPCVACLDTSHGHYEFRLEYLEDGEWISAHEPGLSYAATGENFYTSPRDAVAAYLRDSRRLGGLRVTGRWVGAWTSLG